MKMIKRVLLKFFMWYFWKQFLLGLKSVLGYKSLAASIYSMKNLESIIRVENNLKRTDKITWENSKKTDREAFAKYATLRHFNEVGELLVFFRAIELKKLLGSV